MATWPRTFRISCAMLINSNGDDGSTEVQKRGSSPWLQRAIDCQPTKQAYPELESASWGQLISAEISGNVVKLVH